MDETNFADGIKKIFSDDSFQCCIPTGEDVPPNTTAKDCCTGNISTDNTRCVLPDFANVSLYLNKYVSSAATGISANLFNDETGYLKSASTVELLACELEICQSGEIAKGVAHSELRIKGNTDADPFQSFRRARFIEGDSPTDNFSGLVDLFKRGLKWNNNVYCFPPGGGDGGGDGSSPVSVTACASGVVGGGGPDSDGN